MSLTEDAVAVLGHCAAGGLGVGQGPADAVTQQVLVRTGLDLLAQGPAWQRSYLPTHLTASALVVSSDGADVLLTLHARLGRWLQTGGHIEASDATLRAAAAREATEESGISALELSAHPVRLDLHPVPCGPARTPAQHLDLQYVAVAATRAVPVVSEESVQVAWFPAAALPAGVDDSVRALVAAATAWLGARP